MSFDDFSNRDVNDLMTTGGIILIIVRNSYEGEKSGWRLPMRRMMR